MKTNRLTAVAAAFALMGAAACGGADQEYVETDTEIVTERGTEIREIEVPTEDTLLVEREVRTQVDVDVDTTRIRGDQVPPRQ
jgi:hypothetical protein